MGHPDTNHPEMWATRHQLHVGVVGRHPLRDVVGFDGLASNGWPHLAILQSVISNGADRETNRVVEKPAVGMSGKTHDAYSRGLPPFAKSAKGWGHPARVKLVPFPIERGCGWVMHGKATIPTVVVSLSRPWRAKGWGTRPFPSCPRSRGSDIIRLWRRLTSNSLLPRP
jgi:hypothetical protein